MVSRCKSNNIWILILEKALAKIYGCYYNLTALNIFDFFNVLTGCPTYFFSINDALNNLFLVPSSHTFLKIINISFLIFFKFKI